MNVVSYRNLTTSKADFLVTTVNVLNGHYQTVHPPPLTPVLTHFVIPPHFVIPDAFCNPVIHLATLCNP